MKEKLKNIIIAALFVSLIALTFLNIMYDRVGGDFIADATAFLPSAIAEPARPALAVAVIGGEMFAAGYGDAGVGAVYERFRISISEALASAVGRREITRAAWGAIMEEDCVFFKFIDRVPVWTLADGLSVTASEAVLDLSVEGLILSGDRLFINTGEDYFRCDVFIGFNMPEQVESQLSRARFVNGVVVIDGENEYHEAVLTDRYRDDIYISEILTAMGFNPNTNNRYTQADGDIVFVDEQRTLHVGLSGRVTYRDGTVQADGITDEREALRLAMNSIPVGTAFWGDGHLNFSDIEARDGIVNVEFEYALNGAAFIGRRALFAVRGSRIIEADMWLCPAVLGERRVELIPQRQAALLLREGAGLELRYVESENGVWRPGWYER
jgi:hypothetical protein